MDGMLSQEEINALLAGASGSGDSSTTDSSADNNAQNAAGQEDNNNTPSAQNEQQFVLSDSEKDAVGEISNISMGTAATTLSSLLNQKVNITTPTVEVSTWDELSVKYDRPCVMLQISYKEGIDGNNVLILKERDVKIITDLMMGGAGQVDDDEPLSELHLSAIGEAMNQMMGSAATSMSSMFNRKIDISPPIANMVETYSDSTDDLPPFLKGQFVMVAFKMQIGDLIDSEIMQILPLDVAKEMVTFLMGGGADAAEEPAPEPAPAIAAPAPAPAAPAPAPAPAPVAPPPQPAVAAAPQYAAPQYAAPPVQPQYAAPAYAQTSVVGAGVPVQPAQIAPLTNEPVTVNAANISLIQDVPLQVTVELGRTKKSIREILEFSTGSIIELDKLAGEPVDIHVNGQLTAKVEVVVIDENFGVRITEIVNPLDRIQSL